MKRIRRRAVMFGSAPIVGLIVSAIGFYSITAAVVATVVLDAVLTIGVSALINALTGSSRQQTQQRQAQVTALAIGEQPRVAVFGIGAVPGVLQ